MSGDASIPIGGDNSMNGSNFSSADMNDFFDRIANQSKYDPNFNPLVSKAFGNNSGSQFVGNTLNSAVSHAAGSGLGGMVKKQLIGAVIKALL